ncbi:hypothetical protein X946_1075 [Burkholderia sp. ABCPW 111]|nr:hypothetical protein X946_1075 [Burkholderia sp. ABCPW 111]
MPPCCILNDIKFQWVSVRGGLLKKTHKFLNLWVRFSHVMRLSTRHCSKTHKVRFSAPPNKALRGVGGIG